MPDRPMHIERVALRGARVSLEPLTKEHLPGIASAIHDGKLWTIPVTFVPHPDDLESFLAEADRRFADGWGLAFAIFDVASGKIVGSTRFRNIDVGHRRVEIGFTFVAQTWQRSYVNTEAKYVMLSHAFDRWGCARVEFITDVRNTRSREAILRFGAREEGVMRNHMIMRDGHHRDSVLYSVMDSEWPAVRAWFETKMAIV